MNRVIYVGPMGGAVGGLVSGARMIVESALWTRTELVPCPITVPGQGSLPARFTQDLRTFWKTARANPQHRVVMMQVVGFRGVWREWALARLARRLGRRLVLNIRAGEILDFLDKASAAEGLAFRRLMDAASVVLVQVESFIEELRRRFPRTRFEWFPNFVKAAEFGERPPRAPGPLRCVNFGRLVAEKGVPELIAAGREAGVEVHLAGTADPALDLGGATHHGALARPALLELLRRMDLFVFPTAYSGEGHSNALNEAMMCGLGVLATRHNQNERILPPEGVVWITKDVGSIAAALRALDTSAAARMGEANRRSIRERFTDTTWIPFLEGIFEEAAA